MCDTDVLIGGFGLFGGRGEYMGKIKVKVTNVYFYFFYACFVCFFFIEVVEVLKLLVYILRVANV